MSLEHHRVLVVDDNPGDAELAADRLTDAPGCDFETRHASTLAQALTAIAELSPEIVILDLNLPDSTGLDTLRRVRDVAPATPVIVVTGALNDRLREEALMAGAEDALSKNDTSGRLFYRTVLYVVERQRARTQHRQLEQVLDATPDAILAINERGEVRFANPAAATLLGRSREELLTERLALAITDGATLELNLPHGGGRRVCEMRVVPMDWNGEATSLVSMRDITERQQAEALRRRSIELQLQNERIRQASELKSAFVAHMSHEIRTPMNAVIGLTHVLGRTRLDDDQRSMLVKLQSAGTALMALLNNVLDLSKIEAGEVALEDIPFELPALVEQVAQVLAPPAQDKGLTLDMVLAPNLPRWVRGDPTRLRQILTNLVGNAIKFTERGGVTVTVSPREDDAARLSFSVRDSGIGMESETLDRLFRPFVQADLSTTRRFGGTGLGLSIVRHLAELMGGRVAVQSRVGKGSTFIVDLPINASGQGAEAAAGVTLLAIGHEAAHALSDACAELGWRLERSAGAASAMATADGRQVEAAACDAIVHDVGVTMAEEASADAPPTLPLAATHARAEGLFNAIYGLLHQRGRDTAAALGGTRVDAPGLRWLSGARVMVVDDSEINCEVARRLLAHQGAEVDAFNDATSALEQLDADPGRYDAVLMDVQMPKLDGIEATRRIRSSPRVAAVPVIALTAGALVGERQRALDAGMNDFLAKPIEPASLVRTLRRHVERHRGRVLAVEARTEAVLSPAMLQIDGVDGRSWPLYLGSDDPALFLRLARQMFEEYAELGAGAPDDGAALERLRASVHKLRGAAGALAMTELQRHAADLDSALRVGAQQDMAPGLARVLCCMRELRARVEAWARSLPAPKEDADDEASRSDGEGCRSEPADTDTELRALLDSQDLAAATWVRRHAPGLRRRLGTERFDGLCAAVERLDFRRAVTLLN